MKRLHSTILALALGAASISSAFAHDSFSIGVNIGGYGYAAPAIGYSSGYVLGYSQAPTVVYPQTIYYGRPTAYYYPPVVSYRYSNSDRGWGHERREHRGWGRDGWEHGERGRHEERR